MAQLCEPPSKIWSYRPCFGHKVRTFILYSVYLSSDSVLQYEGTLVKPQGDYVRTNEHVLQPSHDTAERCCTSAVYLSLRPASLGPPRFHLSSKPTYTSRSHFGVLFRGVSGSGEGLYRGTGADNVSLCTSLVPPFVECLCALFCFLPSQLFVSAVCARVCVVKVSATNYGVEI